MSAMLDNAELLGRVLLVPAYLICGMRGAYLIGAGSPERQLLAIVVFLWGATGALEQVARLMGAPNAG